MILFLKLNNFFVGHLDAFLLKINPHISENIYNAFQLPIFFICFFISIIIMIKTLTNRENRIIYISMQFIVTLVVIFMIFNPDGFCRFCEDIFNYLSSFYKAVFT